MPVQNYIQTSFTAGEFSPKLLARPDLQKYGSGAEQLENVLVMPWGGVRKRGGTVFMHNTRNDAAVRLQRFVFSTTQAYVAEFSDSNIRLFTSSGILTDTATTITNITQASPGVVTAASHGLSNGQRVIISGVSGMFEVNNREFTVAGATASTFQLSGVDTSGFTAYSSAGSVAKIIEVSAPYTAADLSQLEFTQSADTLYIAHPSYSPRTLVRNSATSWTLSEASITGGPFRDINTDDTLTMYLSGGSATAYGTYAEGDTGILLTASSAYFTSSMVGGLFRLFVAKNGGGGWSQLVGDQTDLAANRLYENAGNVYACTAETVAASTWQPSMALPTHTEGTVRVINDGNTASYADMLFVHDGSVQLRVTGFNSTTEVEVTVEKNHAPAEVIGASNTTAFWEEGAWSAERGWPAKITFYEERLWFARNSSQPQTVWSSRTGAFLDFLDGDEDADAITFTISSEQVDAVQWINGGRVLSLGTTDGEYVATAERPTLPLSPADITIRRQSRYGSADNVRPERVGESILFAQRNGDTSNGSRIVREHGYSFEADGYTARNITLIADHITGAGVSQFAYQPSPYSVMWAKRSDGRLAGLTFEKDQDVVAWHRHIYGGVSDGSGSIAKVEQIEVIPGATGDDLWLVVQRYVNSATVRHVERMTLGLDDDGAIADATFLDAHLTYSGASTATITGLWHLRGETVRVFYNGADQGTKTVGATGSVTLDDSVTAAVIGYGYTAKIKTLRVEAGIASGTAQGKRKRISEVTVRLYQSYDGAVGGDATRTDSIPYDSVALFTGDKRIEFPDGWTYDGQVYFEHTTAYPFVPLGIIQEVRGSG